MDFSILHKRNSFQSKESKGLTRNYWIILFTYIGAQFSVIVLAPLLYFLSPLTGMEAQIHGNILGFVLGLLIILHFLKDEMKRFEWSFTTFKEIFIWTILGVVLAYIAQTIASLIEVHLFEVDVDSENTTLLVEITKNVPIFVIVVTIIAPVLEEIVFRKIIFGFFYTKTNFFIAATLSALIFGVVHQELTHLLIYASMGFVFAYLYVKTKKILVPILVHVILNSVTMIVQLSLSPEDLENLQRQWDELQTIILGFIF